MSAPKRLRPNVVHRHIVSNQSSRNGVVPDLITIHTTEGQEIPDSARDLIGLGNFFDVPSTDASSHVANDSDGQSARYVVDSQKAWTQAFFNPRCLSIEQVGFASRWWKMWRTKDRDQLRETARWIAHWSIKYDIPIRRSLGGRRSGVATHKSLGAAGGGHVDPGIGFPMLLCLRMARQIKREILRARRAAT